MKSADGTAHREGESLKRA